MVMVLFRGSRDTTEQNLKIQGSIFFFFFFFRMVIADCLDIGGEGGSVGMRLTSKLLG